ncbi:MAG: 50S ribosomal protein L13, partial [Proteobacteria bacterium]|nr:50S ribosomal protein L13 [Pseudomonadota bacterium]
MSNQGTTKFFTKDTVQRKWVLIDAKDKTLGRLATEIAAILRGKNKAEFTPNQDCGDFV